MTREPLVVLPTYVVTMYVPRGIAEGAPARTVEAFLGHIDYMVKANEVFPVSAWSFEALQPAAVLVNGVRALVFDNEPIMPAADGIMLRASCDAIPLPCRAPTQPGEATMYGVKPPDGYPTIYGGPWS